MFILFLVDVWAKICWIILLLIALCWSDWRPSWLIVLVSAVSFIFTCKLLILKRQRRCGMRGSLQGPGTAFLIVLGKFASERLMLLETAHLLFHNPGTIPWCGRLPLHLDGLLQGEVRWISITLKLGVTDSFFLVLRRVGYIERWLVVSLPSVHAGSFVLGILGSASSLIGLRCVASCYFFRRALQRETIWLHRGNCLEKLVEWYFAISINVESPDDAIDFLWLNQMAHSFQKAL